MAPASSPPARDRLLQAAARLLADSGGEPVATRAICEAAGVTAPTLYHHFGDKQGLLDAVVAHGFAEYLARKRTLESTGDPLEDLRRGWDDHTDFGVSRPAFYALMYGQVRPGHRPEAAAEAEAMLRAKLDGLAARGMLAVPPAQAARMILAANVGLTLALIDDPATTDDGGLSHRVRDAVFAAVLRPDAGAAPRRALPAAASAITLRAALGAGEGAGALTPPERALLEAWLDRIAAAG